MTTQVDATFSNGVFTPDRPLSLADQARVRLTVEPVEAAPTNQNSWAEFKAWILQNAVHGGGKRLTRDELYERR